MKYIFFLLSLLIIASCKSEDAAKAPTKTELVARNWKAETIVATVAGSKVKLFPDVQVIKDAGYDFSKVKLKVGTNGTAIFINVDGSTIDGKWAFAENETVVNVNGAQQQLKLKITTLTDKKLEFDTDYVLDRGVSLLGLNKGQSVPTTITMIPE
jgi:hypothetical protein